MKHKISKTSRLVQVITLVLTLSSAPLARADQMKEFITSCTYGVLAGTLVGAASLAFTQKPGENLNNIARGASLGLYAGIFLGLYVVYGTGPDEEQAVDAQTGGTTRVKIKSPPAWTLAPMWEQEKLTGAVATTRVFSF